MDFGKIKKKLEVWMLMLVKSSLFSIDTPVRFAINWTLVADRLSDISDVILINICLLISAVFIVH